MNLTDRDVQDILRLLESSEFEELHLSTDRFELTLRRSAGSRTGSGAWTEERRTLSPPRALSLDAARATAAEAPAAAREPASRAGAGGPRGAIEIRPPLMGTFYRAPKPGAPPFVEKGAKVAETTVIGIVETMKLMNSIYAGARGEIVEICAENGQLVEQHDVLMRLAPEQP